MLQTVHTKGDFQLPPPASMFFLKLNPNRLGCCCQKREQDTRRTVLKASSSPRPSCWCPGGGAERWNGGRGMDGGCVCGRNIRELGVYSKWGREACSLWTCVDMWMCGDVWMCGHVDKYSVSSSNATTCYQGYLPFSCLLHPQNKTQRVSNKTFNPSQRAYVCSAF